jgi:hypothetical protein
MVAGFGHSDSNTGFARFADFIVAAGQHVVERAERVRRGGR